MAEINISAGTSVNLYDELGANVGADRILVQTKSDSPVYLTKNNTQPTDKNNGIRLKTNELALNSTSDAGAFVSAYLSDAKVFAEVYTA